MNIAASSVSHSSIENPLWDAIEGMCARGAITKHPWGFLEVQDGHRWEYNALTARYSPVLSSPGLVDWLLRVTGKRVVQVDAGTGYYSWMLRQAGFDAVALDRAKHRQLWAIRRLGPRLAQLEDYPNRTLLVVAPTNMDRIHRILQKYSGNRAVLILRHEPDPTLDTRPRVDRKTGRPKPWSKAAIGRREDRARLDAYLAQSWRLADKAQGTCVVEDVYEAYLYQRRSTWDAEPTTLYPLLRIGGDGSVRPAA